MWVWGIIYPVVNICLIAMHYYLAPAMYAWIRLAPLPVAAIDNVKPWAQPENYVAEARVEEIELSNEEE